MAKPEAIIVVTADWEAAGKYVMEACERASKELNLPVEVKKEDWNFLVDYGEKDEFGGVDIPQVFLKLDDGSIVHIMTRVPLTSKGEPDIDAAVKKIVEAASR